MKLRDVSSQFILFSLVMCSSYAQQDTYVRQADIRYATPQKRTLKQRFISALRAVKRKTGNLYRANPVLFKTLVATAVVGAAAGTRVGVKKWQKRRAQRAELEQSAAVVSREELEEEKIVEPVAEPVTQLVIEPAVAPEVTREADLAAMERRRAEQAGKAPSEWELVDRPDTDDEKIRAEEWEVVDKPTEQLAVEPAVAPEDTGGSYLAALERRRAEQRQKALSEWELVDRPDTDDTAVPTDDEWKMLVDPLLTPPATKGEQRTTLVTRKRRMVKKRKEPLPPPIEFPYAHKREKASERAFVRPEPRRRPQPSSLLRKIKGEEPLPPPIEFPTGHKREKASERAFVRPEPLPQPLPFPKGHRMEEEKPLPQPLPFQDDTGDLSQLPPIPKDVVPEAQRVQKVEAEPHDLSLLEQIEKGRKLTPVQERVLAEPQAPKKQASESKSRADLWQAGFAQMQSKFAGARSDDNDSDDEDEDDGWDDQEGY